MRMADDDEGGQDEFKGGQTRRSESKLKRQAFRRSRSHLNRANHRFQLSRLRAPFTRAKEDKSRNA